MTDTANLALPCIEGGQAQKHVTHNEALRVLDTLVQLAVLDRDLTAPPGSPAEGQRWIVKAGATGAWASHVDAVAAWQDGAWQFSTPRTGWLAYVVDESVLLAWNGSAWVDAIGALSPTALNNMTLLGVGTLADATNPLSAKLNNTLFAARTVAEGGDGNLRCKLSKESAAKTLSFLFQDNYSGRAEIGLTGDDDFHFKVSADGTTWRDGIVIDKTTGAVTFPHTAIVAGREVLTANRTYYVRTDGSNGNNGLANTSGGAFLTIQKAIDTVAALDISIYTVTIQVGNGTYTGASILKAPLGSGEVWIVGDETTPANVLISTTSASCFSGVFRGIFRLRGMKMTCATSGNCIFINGAGSVVYFRNIDFGAMVGWHLQANNGAYIQTDGNYTISAGGPGHAIASGPGAYISINSLTLTLSGTPAFSLVFLQAQLCGVVNCPAANVTFSGAATGVRYLASENGVVRTNGGGATFLPGSSAGSTASGGQYT